MYDNFYYSADNILLEKDEKSLTQEWWVGTRLGELFTSKSINMDSLTVPVKASAMLRLSICGNDTLSLLSLGVI